MNTAPLLFLHLLADRHGVPSALLFCPGRDESGAAPPDDESWAALAAKFPCFYRQELAPAVAESLRAAGWMPLAVDGLLRVDGPLGALPAAPLQWLSGDWCLAPPPKVPARQAASQALALQLLQLVALDACTHEIETLLRHDPTLSYHLLRLVNSVGIGNGRRVSSFAQAILILGRQQLRRWLNLMLFAARDNDVRARMLLARVAVRARALELLAKACGMDQSGQEQAFMCGMFSLLGVLFGMTLADLLRPLNLGQATQAALLAREGELGALLAVLETAEGGQHEALAATLTQLGLEAGQFNDVVTAANLWMLDALPDGGAHV